MRICIDIDNTLADYTAALRRVVRETGWRGECRTPEQYDFSADPTWPWAHTPDPQSMFRRFIADHAIRILMREHPYSHAVRTIRRLKADGWRIIVTTARPVFQYDLTAAQLERWRLDADMLALTGDPTLIDADVYVNDRPEALERLAGVHPGALLLHPAHAYCRDACGTTYADWRDAGRLIGEWSRP